jgi:hypothetical protein
VRYILWSIPFVLFLSPAAGQGKADEKAAASAAQAVMPRKFITPTVAQLEVGEHGYINNKALVVDDKHRCWVVKTAHVHEDQADAGGWTEVLRASSGYQVILHAEYKWKTLPPAGLAEDCFPVESLTDATHKEKK